MKERLPYINRPPIPRLIENLGKTILHQVHRPEREVRPAQISIYSRRSKK